MGKEKIKDWMTTRRERDGYGFYFTGQNIFYAIVTSFLSTYLLFLGIDLTKAAAVMLVVKVWDAVNDALFGAIFDKVKFKSGQKCLPWLKISLGFIPLATIFLFVIPQALPEGAKLAWFAIAYLLYDTAYTICDVPIYSMVTTMTDNLDERNSLMARGRIFSAVGMGIAGLLCTVLISEKVGLGFNVAAIALSVIGFAFMLPLCLVGKERNYHADLLHEETFTFRQMFSYLGKNRNLLSFFGGYIVRGCLGTNVALGLFVSYYLFGNSLFSLLLTVLSAAPAAIFAFFTPAILRRVDKFKLYLWMNVIGAVLGLVIYFVGYKNVVGFIALSLLRSIPMGLIGMTDFMFTPDCAEYGRYKTGTDARGITFAIQTFSSKVGSAVSQSLALFLLGLFGWVEVTAQSFEDLEANPVLQPDSAINGLWITYALVPVIGCFLALVFLAFYRLNDKDVQIMAKCNAGEITREEAEAQLSKKY